ncbi:ROK family transcriptional regulator [Microbacterium sp. ET2]|uniref:ROK family transcriptional regulator n=1 Tax=Microbacterium albipurpureum TaxID=3050384 RepID=UPI00259D25EE|nr:ROK family transcriptional regulator [Microbacterium sp. ET2 (Ac-2212)]WJL96856.1 ROK family transcriptional regulator [Microbacterium sp. ET2 (Ac-2212)]
MSLVGPGGRQRNLSTILTLLHRLGPLSRASLTEATRLNRSTIADLVGQLVRHGLVTERAPDPARRVGRPSPIVAVSPRVVAVAVNPEVDAITLAVVRLDQTTVIRERHEVDRPPTPEEATALLAARLEAWRRGVLADAAIVGIGLAVPGLVRASDGLVRDAPHLHWRDVPLGDLVAEATGLLTRVANDASLGAMAEHLFGAARGVDDVVYLNGGASGIGGGLIVGGVTVGGSGGYAGEFGQNRPGIADGADRLAADGVLEDEVSRSRLLAAVGLDSADEPTLAAALADPPDPGTRAAVSAEVERQRRILSTALANAVNVLNPSVVVLGGFLATIADVDVAGLLARVRAQAMPAATEDLQLRLASLAEDRLLIGAAEVVFDALLADPSSALELAGSVDVDAEVSAAAVPSSP